MAKYYYTTKSLAKRGGTTVLYFPKEWGIEAGVPVKFSFWTAGERMPDSLLKLPLITRDMNSLGIIGVYIPKTYIEAFDIQSKISVCIIIGEEEKDGDA